MSHGMISIDTGRKSSFATYGYISMFQNGNPALIQDSRQVRQHNFPAQYASLHCTTHLWEYMGVLDYLLPTMLYFA